MTPQVPRRRHAWEQLGVQHDVAMESEGQLAIAAIVGFVCWYVSAGT